MDDERIDRRPETGDRTGERYKFQRLQVYQLGLDHVDMVYGLTATFPKSET